VVKGGVEPPTFRFSGWQTRRLTKRSIPLCGQDGATGCPSAYRDVGLRGVPHTCHSNSPMVLTHGDSRTAKTCADLATSRFHQVPRLFSKQLVTADQGAGLGFVRSFVHEVADETA
jgi:hypothetical protein